MADTHPVQTSIIGTTVGGLLLTLILWAFGRLGVVWQALWSVVLWVWRQIITPVSVPVWLILLVAGYVIVMAVVARRRRTATLIPSNEPAAFHPGGPPQAPRELDKLQAKVMRAMGEADGGTPTVEDLADDLSLSQLRLEQTLEELEAIGYIEIIRHVVDGPVVDVTRAGRDYLIAKRLV